MRERNHGVTGRNGLMKACAMVLMVALATAGVQAQGNYVELPKHPSVIELAICLDASGSMDGLIDGAKQKLWAIVNDLALAEPTPKLRVALLTFGNDGHEVRDGWVALQTPFTSDLDLVSERLFAVTTNGGTEYVGRVLQSAGALRWSKPADALQLIMVAGNESVDQDTLVSFRTMSRQMIARGIVVNAIYCGAAEDGLAPAWREVAQLADGTFATIDHNSGTIVIATPFDDQLGVLSSDLNLTYIPFGARGLAGAENQTAQDANAAGMNSATKAARAVAKSSAMYNCAWDLVDACRAGDVKVADLDSDDLPEEMKNLNTEERQKYIDDKAAQREAIQRKIAGLKVSRDAFIRDEMKRGALNDTLAFDNAMRRAIRAQALARGFRFKGEKLKSPSERSQEQNSDRPGTVRAQLASSNPLASPAENPLDLEEAAILRGVFARAMSVRPGEAVNDTRMVDSRRRVIPDLVVALGTQDDLRLIKTMLRPSSWTQLGSPGEILLMIDGQAILLTAEGC